MQNEPKDLELIQTTALLLGVPDAVIEKDLLVTRAIAAVTSVQHDHFQLIFQGGTALAKAHHLVKRMSEDCDFRLAYQSPTNTLNKDTQRKLLRGFRHQLLTALVDSGFTIAHEDIKVRNEGQFITMRARYDSAFSDARELKPYLALEFFLGKVRTPTLQRAVTTLIRDTLGNKIDHPVVQVNCMSIVETAAEKWVALTRRVATAAERDSYYDKALVRHIYDLAMINAAHPLSNTHFAQLVEQVVRSDRKQFKTHNVHYHEDPVPEIKRALLELKTNPLWAAHWQSFMETMVYGDKPQYAEALITLETLSQLALQSISSAGI